MYNEGNIYIMAIGRFYIQCSLPSSPKERYGMPRHHSMKWFPRAPPSRGRAVSTEWLVSNLDGFANKEAASVFWAPLYRKQTPVREIC